MAHRLDRLFTQAMTGEALRCEPSRGAPPPPPPPDDEEPPSAPADPSEPERILAAFKRKDYAGCLCLPAVTLDDLGRPQWPVTDRRAHSRLAVACVTRVRLTHCGRMSRAVT